MTENKQQEVKVEEVKKKEFISMKKGDYTVHIFIEEVKNLISKEEEPPLPIVKMTVLKDTKRTNELEEKVSTYFFGEHFYFDCLDMNNATLDSAKVKIEVIDQNFSGISDYIGIHEFDFSFVYNSENHAINNYWVALVNPCSDDFSKIRGYLRFSCSVLHSSDKRVELNSGNSNSECINFPPQIKIEYYEVSLVILKAENLADMDTTVHLLSSVNKSDKKIDAFVKANYMGKIVQTSVVSSKANIVVWNEQLFLPVSFPVISEKILCSVWDHDVGSDDIVGSFEINVNDILSGYYDIVRTVHLYGAPVDRHLTTIMNSTEKKMTNYMNENCEIGSLWKGKISIMATHKKVDFPKTATIEIPNDSPLLKISNKSKSTTWTFEITIEKAIFLPFESENYCIACILEEEKVMWGPEKSRLNMLDIKSRQTQKLTITTNTDEIRDLPELFFYLIKGSKDEEKNRICFQRIEANFFIKHNDYLILKFYPDPVIGEINDISKSGLLKVKVQVSKNGQICLLENITNKVNELKDGLMTKVEMKVDNIIKKEDKDSDSEGLDEKYMNKIQKPELTKVNKVGKTNSSKVTVGVNIHQTAKLIAGDDNGLSDPFIIVKMLDQEKKSSIKYNSLNGIWNETLIFSGLEFDINDEKTYPEVFLQVLDYDSLSSNDVLGFTYLWINDLPNLKNSLNPIIPSWVDLHLNLSNKKQGKILLSFYIIEETKTDLINKLNKLDISPESTNYCFEINVLGLRGLQSKGIIPVKKPYIIFDINSISSTSKKTENKSSSQKESIKTEPKESGCDPNINTVISFENFLPKEKVFTPVMECYVYDYLLGGLGNSLLGVFELDISNIVSQTMNEFSKIKNLCEKKFSNKVLGNSLVKNSLRIIDEKEKLEFQRKIGDVLEEKKEIKPEDINMVINDESNSNTNNPSDKKQIEKHDNEEIKIDNNEEEKVERNKSQRVRSYTTKKTFQNIDKVDSTEEGIKMVILPSFKTYSLPKANEKKESTDAKKDDNNIKKDEKALNNENKELNKEGAKNDKDKEIIKEDPNQNKEIKKEEVSNDKDKNNSNDKNKEETNFQKKDYTTVYVIEDHSKAPNSNEYVKLGYVKVSTLGDDQKIEDVIAKKQDEYQMHYRRKYNLPLEDPRNGLGIACPFVKIPIYSGAFDDVNDPLNIFKAMSKNRYKIFKDLGSNDKTDLNISSTSIGQDSETRTMGYFKGLTRIVEKNQMKEYQKFLKNMEGKVNLSNLSQYEEISKNILVSKEVVVRVYILELNGLAEKDYLSKSDPFLKIILGETEINEQKNHFDDVTDCVIRKSYE